MNTRTTITVTLLLRSAISLADAQNAPAQNAPSKAGDFVVDYDVPKSPAFNALGVAPANGVRAGAVKPRAGRVCVPRHRSSSLRH